MGGLPPDALVEREEDILKDSIRVVDAFPTPRPAPWSGLALRHARPFPLVAS